jgi:hypothetical protein
MSRSAMTRTRSFELPEYAVSDEAAAYIADTLMEIALQFETAHNPGQQLDLFDKH